VGPFDVTQALLERALVGSSMRQTALANNIANANTPGFKRSDVDFASTLAGALAGKESPSEVDATPFSAVTDKTTSSRLDGNNVDIDGEMASLSENSVTYQALVAVAKARLRMLEIAAGSH
jgi:flagellar basal-body rod protein FlgB